MSIGDNVKKYRIKQGLRQWELALIVGVANPTISNIEMGKRNTSIKLVNKIAHALRCSVSDLIQE